MSHSLSVETGEEDAGGAALAVADPDVALAAAEPTDIEPATTDRFVKVGA